MPSSGLLALVDDVASIADDVAKMTATATQKASGIVIDDLAVTAESMQGLRRDRELRVVWEVAKGSFKNKMLYLVPGALALAAFAPWALPPLLMGGGFYLAYEGAEKVHEMFGKSHGEAEKSDKPVMQNMAAYEKNRIDGAIRTDMVLSGEIMMMGLNTMVSKGLLFKLAALPAYGLAMTAGVYGTVAGLVKIDDAGAWLAKRENKVLQKIGQGIVRATPGILHGIGTIGTAAMLAVGGQLIAHNMPGGIGHLLDHGVELASHAMHLTSGFANGLLGYAVEAGFGLAAGLGVERAVATGIPARVLQAITGPAKRLATRLGGSVGRKQEHGPGAKPELSVSGMTPDSVSPKRKLNLLGSVPEGARPSELMQCFCRACSLQDHEYRQKVANQTMSL